MPFGSGALKSKAGQAMTREDKLVEHFAQTTAQRLLAMSEVDRKAELDKIDQELITELGRRQFDSLLRLLSH